MYDISDDNLRNKIAKKLINEGAERIQFSVFVTHLNPYKGNLFKQINNLICKAGNDKIFIMPVLKRNFYKIKILGKFENDIKYLAGDKSSLIL